MRRWRGHSRRIPRAHEIALDWQAFAYLLVTCVATAILLGLAPALVAARPRGGGALGGEGRTQTMGRGYRRLRDALVVAEVGLAFMLSLGAVAIVGEAARLRHVDAGLVTANVLTLHVTPAAPAHDYEGIVERVTGLPGVEAVGFIQLLPLQNWGWEATFAIEDVDEPENGQEPTAALRYVTPGYFETLRIPIVEGRGFTSADHGDAPAVILVNQALARRYFPGTGAVGRATDRGTIVGVVGDVRSAGPARPPEPELYYAVSQNLTMASDLGMSLLVRTTGGGGPSLADLRAAIASVNPSLAVSRVRSMDDVAADALGELNLYRC